MIYTAIVNVIAYKALRAFTQTLPESEGAQAEEAMREWFNRLRKLEPANFAELKAAFNTADITGIFTIFNVGGNKYRLVTAIVYTAKRAYIKHVFTHAQYDRWNAARRKKGRK